MSKTIGILESQRSLESTIAQKMEDFEARLTNISPRTSSMENLSKDFVAFRTFVHSMLHLLRQQITEVSLEVDSIETRYRNKFLLLGGITEKDNEDVPKIISEVLSKQMGLSITSADISSAHRLGKPGIARPRPILFRPCNSELRLAMWKKKTSLKGTSYILTEFLTKYRQSLFMEARKHFSMRNVWTSNGVVFIKLNDGGFKKIRSIDDLSIITSLYCSPSSDPAPESPRQVSLKSASTSAPAPCQRKLELTTRSKRTIKNK